MKINTKYHGEIEVKKEDILKFEQGIPGFAEEKGFMLLPLPENDWFHILQSVSTPQLGFVVTDPFLFTNEYDFELEAESVDLLGLTSEKDVKVLTILTMKEALNDSTANLQAPIIINLASNKAKQVILNNTNYKTKHFIFAQPEQSGKE
ncbi:flagellar assembly protein FliW [[Bacillus] enclensis]|uniref:Flagellar assembly factor FliW n=1 Tax=[Bacillus] enclensis TaxID=1402860 RepID=A0A0V8HBJ9_9BACI|nr:flagellar assembly protein FliW [[Bacillus] enclensis]KSU59830.1 flagellar assembly protein FliW [[Bacillus] enclensis]SCC27802.1 flagellar assembly factor FliW [[Bacillus] enclensis]